MIILGIAGGSGSGKTTLVNHLVAAYPKGWLAHLPLDAYYHDHSYLTEAEKKTYNFDHPNAIDFDLMIDHLKKMSLNIPVFRPVYSFLSCSRLNQTVRIDPPEVVIIDGLFTLLNEKIRSMLHSKFYLDVTPSKRLERIIRRDVRERGRSRSGVRKRFAEMVEPMHLLFVEPTRKFADHILDGNSADIGANLEILHSIVSLGQPAVRLSSQ